MDGWPVMERLRKDARLAAIPIIVLSADLDADRFRASSDTSAKVASTPTRFWRSFTERTPSALAHNFSTPRAKRLARVLNLGHLASRAVEPFPAHRPTSGGYLSWLEGEGQIPLPAPAPRASRVVRRGTLRAVLCPQSPSRQYRWPSLQQSRPEWSRLACPYRSPGRSSRQRQSRWARSGREQPEMPTRSARTVSVGRIGFIVVSPHRDDTRTRPRRKLGVLRGRLYADSLTLSRRRQGSAILCLTKEETSCTTAEPVASSC